MGATMAKSPPPRAAGAESAVELADRLRVTAVRLGRQLRRRDRSGLTMSQYSALATVVDHGALSVGELATSEHVPSPGATRIADRLEESGLIARQRNPHDRRGVVLTPTREGRRLVTRQRARGNAWLASRLADITPAEREVLRDALVLLEAAVLRPDAPAARRGGPA